MRKMNQYEVFNITLRDITSFFELQELTYMRRVQELHDWLNVID
jgi:hypothetical protein